MENIFVEFLPPWIETGLQPAFYDKESGTALQQTARMYARVNMLIRMFNKLSKNTKTTVEDYINQFNELHDYVHDYFDNLDVQNEINNKLDQMVADGAFQAILDAYVRPELDNLDYKITQGLTDERIARVNADNNLQSQISGLASGAPIPVSSMSGMTDTTKIYVLTTSGHWFYYDGNSWEDGGVYQAAVDPTEVSELQDELDVIAIPLEEDLIYDGAFWKWSTELHNTDDYKTIRYKIPKYLTSVYVNTYFYGNLRVFISDISDPTTTAFSNDNALSDPSSNYGTMTNHIATYDLTESQQYSYIYVPYYVSRGKPTVKGYYATAFPKLQDEIDDINEEIDSIPKDLAEKLVYTTRYNGYWQMNASAMTESNDWLTYKFVLPKGTTKIYIKTKFFGQMATFFTDVADPTTIYPSKYIGGNAFADPYSPYTTLAVREKTYTLDRYYDFVYVPCYKDSIPEVIAYRSSDLDTAWNENNPLAGKKVLVFGDSITYTYSRWRESFYNITRMKELACISCAGAHLTDYNDHTTYDGDYTNTSDGGIHNVVGNQVYYWLNNATTEEEPDYIIISAGTNDYYTSPEQLATDINVYATTSGWISLDNVARNTFEGAMRWITSKLRTKYENATIVFASPIQSAQDIGADKSIDVLLAKEAKMQRACDHLNARLIKASSESGITGEFEHDGMNGRYLIDGLHPNRVGGNLLGTFYANSLIAMFQKENTWDKYPS